MDIASGLTAATQALGIAKTLREVDKSYDAVLYKTKIVELMDALVDAKAALTEAKATIEERDKEIASLRASFEDSASLSVGDGDYKFRTDADGRKVGYPICPKCEVGAGKIVQLKQDGSYRKAKCPVCDAQFQPVTCYLPASEITGEIDTVAKRAAENERRSMERLAQANRRSSWIDSRY